MKTFLLCLPLALVFSSCDEEEFPPLREDSPYRQASGERRSQPVGQKIPQGAQATGDAETRSGQGAAGSEAPASGDHVGSGGGAAGNPHGAPTSGGERPERQEEEK